MAFGNRLTESALAFIVRTNLSEHKRDVIKTDDLSELSKEFIIELPSQMKFSQSNKRFSEIEWNSKLFRLLQYHPLQGIPGSAEAVQRKNDPRSK